MPEPSDLVFREMRMGPRTEPWGTPVLGLQVSDMILSNFLCRGDPCGRMIWWFTLFEGCWKVQHSDYWGQWGCSSSVKFIFDGDSVDSACWGSRGLFSNPREICKELGKDWNLSGINDGSKTGLKFFTTDGFSVSFFKRGITLAALRVFGKQAVVKELLMRWMRKGRS